MSSFVISVEMMGSGWIVMFLLCFMCTMFVFFDECFVFMKIFLLVIASLLI